MNDLISRKAAINALISEGRSVDSRYVSAERIIHESDAIEAISMLPSAEQKKGRWIFARYFVWECSECGKNPTRGMGYTQGKSELFRYCPHCGAKMEAEE